MTSTIVVMDTETNGLEPDPAADSGGLLEIAWVPVRLPDHRESDSADDVCWTVGADAAQAWCLEHTQPLDPGARAIHHLRPDQVLPGAPGCLPRAAVMHDLLSAEEPGDMMYAFHNAPFDVKFLPELGLPVIDTLQCAKHLWPDAPKYGNQALRYWLGVEPHPDMTREVVDEVWVPLAPHRALYDIATTAEILRVMLRTHSPEELLRLSTTPLLLVTCEFKKHKGWPWAEVPKSYMQWMKREGVGADDRDLQHTLDHYLSQ